MPIHSIYYIYVVFIHTANIKLLYKNAIMYILINIGMCVLFQVKTSFKNILIREAQQGALTDMLTYGGSRAILALQ